MKKIIVYHLRWQSGFFILTPTIWFCKEKLNLDYWACILIAQFIGALIFYPIDKYIFANEKFKNFLNKLTFKTKKDE